VYKVKSKVSENETKPNANILLNRIYAEADTTFYKEINIDSFVPRWKKEKASITFFFFPKRLQLDYSTQASIRNAVLNTKPSGSSVFGADLVGFLDLESKR
jgi:hypothetical protein